MKKLIAFVALLNLTGIAFAHPHHHEGEDALPTATATREVAINAIIEKLQVRVQSHAFDGDFETGLIFSEGLPDDIKSAIQTVFLKAGYKVVWMFDDRTKELRLVISWR